MYFTFVIELDILLHSRFQIRHISPTANFLNRIEIAHVICNSSSKIVGKQEYLSINITKQYPESIAYFQKSIIFTNNLTTATSHFSQP